MKHAVLLQGPVGPFFRRFSLELRGRGVAVTKISFNAGDELFCPGLPFRAPMSQWPAFFRALVTERGVDAVFLFGDTRPHHRQAVAVATELGVPVWVFEEGYLRPDHITLEPGGVNGNSRMSKDPARYLREAGGSIGLPESVAVGNAFWHSALWAALYSAALTFAGWRYPHYRHHRDYNAFRQGFFWARGGVRKLWYGLTERGQLSRLAGERWFFVPLQVFCDAQLGHSRYRSIDEFIEEVVAAFAAHAPADHRLVFKHHPHDRPYRDYGDLLSALARRHGLGERLVYVHDLHLPTLLKHARGVITMNSTVGTSALYHGTPVKVLGRAIYDVPGLTCQRPLADFLKDPGRVDAELFAAFCRWLCRTSQVNGSLYKHVPGLSLADALDRIGSTPAAGDAAA